jgi:hypothetical protein
MSAENLGLRQEEHDMSKFISIELPAASGIRTRSDDGCPDIKDCLAWDGMIAGIMKQHTDALFDGRVRIEDPAAVAAGTGAPQGFGRFGRGFIAGPKIGGNGNGNGGCPTPNEDGGTPNENCEPMPRECGVTPLTFNSYGVGGYPFPGTVINALVTNPIPIVVAAGRTTWFKPRWLFFSARDAAAAMAQMEGHLTRAEVAGNSQLANVNTTQMAIGSDMFLAQQGPLRIDDWRGFGNTNPNLLNLFFGNAQGVLTALTISGCFWGDPTLAPAGVAS